MKHEKQQIISVLAIVGAREAAGVERIFSHTGWKLRIVHSVGEALEALRSETAAVVLCEERLPDGTWLDFMRETNQLFSRPQTIVLSGPADLRLWAQVLNHGGYDLLAKPLQAPEVYALIPAAWRQWKREAERAPGFRNVDSKLERCYDAN